MGFFDKIKGAVNAVTGGAAKVEMEYLPMVMAGEKLAVRIKATSTGQKVESKGVYVDLAGTEKIKIRRSQAGTESDVELSNATFEKQILIAPAFTLEANETKQWEGVIEMPAGVEPTFSGAYAKHEWFVRGRIEAFGNDPDTGYLPLTVGARPKNEKPN